MYHGLVVIEGNLTHDPGNNVIPNGTYVYNIRVTPNKDKDKGEHRVK